MIDQSGLLTALVLFAFVAFFTPGPNNLMLMASGLNFGVRRSLPSILGVAFGCAFLTLCVGLGLGAVFSALPVLYIILKYAAAIYLLYLAWVIAKSSPPNPNGVSQKKPMTFLQAISFQWINPKGWVMAIAVASNYSEISVYPCNMLTIAGLFVVMGIASSFTWAGLGSVLQYFLHKPRLVRAFNIAMALLLVASLYPVFADNIK